MSKAINLVAYITANTLRCEVSHRGGGIEIDASEYLKIEGARMTAYQNYLGGGMLGSVNSDKNFTTKNKQKSDRVEKLQTALKQYFHGLTVHDEDEWENCSFEEGQSRPASAY